ncbi:MULTISPECIES: hypothetical protein [unclassified Coleofasciculus]|uniref:hypothetical protein n=1 Tax=unclassified Coleofasciculus TaxID=2692782 RepID=UPI0018806233|nr:MULTISPECIES: hypothetical protein [unclassified Coleofasciculus]MBE9124754.1 hypothetical protein [Coleofasciculus sp. LEGE 07081]MBE9148206.1 hypothetical protein [Coleofasciculus sp. LEGE 07092]
MNLTTLLFVVLLSIGLVFSSCADKNKNHSGIKSEAEEATKITLSEEAVAPWHDFFYYVRPQLELNEVPLRLPSYIPPSNQQVGKEGLVAQLIQGTSEKAQYKIVIASPNCGDVVACRYASIEGFKTNANTPSLDAELEAWKSSDLEFSQRAPSPPSTVELAQGIQGYFFPWFVGAYLTEAKVVWLEGEYRYEVGVKGASKQEMIQMANSAIENPDGRVPNL